MSLTDDELVNLVVVLSGRGWSQRRVASELKLPRARVRRILARVEKQRRSGHSALPAAPRRRGSLLDTYADRMGELLERYPDITAVRMHEELKAAGFAGGYTIVKDQLRRLRRQPKEELVTRFETAPGAQGQQDWSPYDVPFTETGRQTVQCFSLVLAYSRRQYLRFCEHSDFFTLIRQHVAAAERFGGLPSEILYDGQKAVVLRWELGRPIYNPRFLAFATHYGFRPHALPPWGKKAAKWKGKVERVFQHVEGHCLRAREFRDLAHLNEHAEWWMSHVSDPHRHGTTRQTPLERFADEAPHLLPLPPRPYDTAEVGYRLVSTEGVVQWAGVSYSVPPAHLLELCAVRDTGDEVIVYGPELTEIARHERQPEGHPEPVVDPAHRPPKRRRHDLEVLTARMAELGEGAARFAAGVARTQRTRGAHLAHVLGLVERYDTSDVLAAIERAERYRAFDGRAVERIVQASAEPRSLPDTLERAAALRLAETARHANVQARPLEDYVRALRKRERKSE
jgi:transposase